MKKLSDATAAIVAYEQSHRHPDRPRFVLGARYSLFPAKGAPSPSWPDSWPNADKRGVYLMLDDDEAVIYVGKASADSWIGARLAKYFQYDANGRCRFIHAEWCPRYVVTVAVPDDSPFEAPALEEFLIKELQPRWNTLGKGKPPAW